MYGPYGGNLAFNDSGTTDEEVAAAFLPLLCSAEGDALGAEEASETTAAIVPFQTDPEAGGLRYAGDLQGLTALDAPQVSRASGLSALAATAAALANLHDAGRVHGDVRPGVVLHSAERTALLTPAFPADASGLLRARLREGANPDAVAYVAPEVVGGAKATSASDVFGLAASAFRILAGRPPLGRLAVGLVAADLGRDLAPVLSRSLNANPQERSTARELHHVLRDAAQRARELDAFTLVDDPDVEAASAEMLTDEEVELREEEERKGKQVSVLLVLVLIVGGAFVFFGALGLVIAGWGAIGKVGQFLVLSMFTAAVWVGGYVLERRGYARSGFCGVVLGSQLVWVNLTHLLVLSDLEDSAGAWAVGSAVMTAMTFLLAGRRNSVTFGCLSALGFVVAASTFGEVISTGSVLGAMIYAACVAVAYGGLAFLGHWAVKRPAVLGLPFAAGAGIWAWISCIISLALLEKNDGGFLPLVWPYLLTLVFVGSAWRLEKHYRIVCIVAAVSLLAIVPTAQSFVEWKSLGFLLWAVMLGLGVLAIAFKWPPIASNSGAQIVTVLLGLINVLFSPAVHCLERCMDRDGLQLLFEALESAGRVYETRFVYLSIPLGTAMGLVAMGYLFSQGATRKAAYRILEVAGLLNFFVLLTLLTLPRCDREFFYITVLTLGGLGVMALGVWGRRAMLVGTASVALLLNLVIQYFAKLSQVMHGGLVAVGFGLGLLGLAILYERKVKGLLPQLKTWA